MCIITYSFSTFPVAVGLLLVFVVVVDRIRGGGGIKDIEI